MGSPEAADCIFRAFGLVDIPTPVFVEQEFDLGFSGLNAHAFPDVLRDGYLTFACYTHSYHLFMSNTQIVILFYWYSNERESINYFGAQSNSLVLLVPNLQIGNREAKLQLRETGSWCFQIRITKLELGN